MKRYINTSDNSIWDYPDNVDPLAIRDGLTLLTEEDFNALSELSPSELQTQAETNFITMTDKHIQAEVRKYNEANNVRFGSIHNCSSYVTVDTYPHQSFCISILKWNADIWEAVRTFQISASSVPTDEEFQAVLDSITFNA